MRISRYRWLLPCLLAVACHKNDLPEPTPTGPVTQREINKWVLDSMRYYYLWNETLPSKVDSTLAPLAWFSQLRNAADPFSILYDRNNGSTYPAYFIYNFGMDFSIVSWPAASGGALGIIKQVVPGGVAYKAGLQRGDYFSRINGSVLTPANATDLSALVLKNGTGTITQAFIDNGVVQEDTTLSLNAYNNGEYPVYATVINNNGKKNGYLFYDAFNDDLNNDLVNAFNYFKQSGISDLIIDLRYNTGGSLSAAAVLTALVAPNVNANTLFLQFNGNKQTGNRNKTFADIMAYPERGAAPVFANLVPAQLSLPRIFILTTHKTVSAAELIINCLKPYTQVIQIGETTYGKDKAAIVITDMRAAPRLSWVLEPLTYRLLNAKGSGGYTSGITPQYAVDELSNLPLRPFGDGSDPLLSKALSVISGNGRSMAPSGIAAGKILFDSRAQAAAASHVLVPR